MQNLIISPSILSLDYAKVSEQLAALERSNAKWLHFDVMDAHFVPNLTFGPDVCKGFRRAVSLMMDVHLMVVDPWFVSDLFLRSGAGLISFHLEAMKDIQDALALCAHIRKHGVMGGIAVKPATPIEPLLPYLDQLDLVLIMSVEPGFGGQSFMPEMLDKVKQVHKEIEQRKLNTRIQIDGGINEATARLAIAAGCDTLVAGSYVFRADIENAVDSLLCLKP
ncbi:MAG: ribulose-phosphate 3-epimerase [Erysipelotrichaceae bacterium]|nr:ribulose-phosphate 3-epimerase [Erysipelotrichaceae bacterium]